MNSWIKTPILSSQLVITGTFLMDIILGSPAVSNFRIEKITQSLAKEGIKVSSISTHFVHLVDTKEALTKEQMQVVKKILSYGPAKVETQSEGELFFVIPRVGTISPWASKATDIAHNCGLNNVLRIERGVAYSVVKDGGALTDSERATVSARIHDRIMETVLSSLEDGAKLFEKQTPKPFNTVALTTGGMDALKKANIELGLALSEPEMQYLMDSFKGIGRDPTDIELYMFAQMNSEHCRHKVFGADWVIDGKKEDKSLFGMIKNTFEQTSDYVLSAYKDNAAVMEGSKAGRFFPNPNHEWAYHEEDMPILMKDETHNHPTAISPFPGAATGSGGEIRDEGATGIGSKPKAGISGFSVSNLRIPGAVQ